MSDRTIRVEDLIATTMVRVRKVWSDNDEWLRQKVTFHLLRNAKELTDKAQYTSRGRIFRSQLVDADAYRSAPYDENGEQLQLHRGRGNHARTHRERPTECLPITKRPYLRTAPNTQC